MSLLANAEHVSLERLSAYLDGELAERELRRVEEHLETCTACKYRLDGMRGVVGGLRSLERVEPPPTLDLWVAHRVDLESHRDGLMERLEGRLASFSGRRQSNILPLFSVILLLAVVSYLFAYGLERNRQVVTPLYFPQGEGVLIDNRPAPGTRFQVADHSLIWDGERYIEEGLRLADLERAQLILVDSPEGKRLLAEGSELAELAKTRRPVVLRLGGKVVELRTGPPA